LWESKSETDSSTQANEKTQDVELGDLEEEQRNQRILIKTEGSAMDIDQEGDVIPKMHQVDWEVLPNEMWLEVFTQVTNGNSMMSVCRVCKGWNRIVNANAPRLWKRVCYYLWSIDPEDKQHELVLNVKNWKDAWQVSCCSWTQSNVKNAFDRVKACATNNETVLYLYNRNLPVLPASMFRIPLVSLNLCGNGMQLIPKQISQLTSLEVLVLSNNRIEVIPPEISKLTRLRELYLSFNLIRSVPKDISTLTNLTDFGIGNNRLREVPPELGLLTNLKYLNLTNEQLQSVPSELSGLLRLQEIRLAECQIDNVLKVFSSLPKLRYFT